MNPLSNFVTLHPYFKVHPGKLETFKAAFPAFIEKTAAEEKNLFYGSRSTAMKFFAAKAISMLKASWRIWITLAQCWPRH